MRTSPMMYRYALFLLLSGTIHFACAQTRTLIGFELAAFLRTADPKQPVDLYLQGSTTRIAPIVQRLGGHMKMSMRNWTSARIPAGRIHELDAFTEIVSIDFRMARGTTLNDSLRRKARIDLVQQGLEPLPQAYDGTGVVVGIVDTGIDHDHPDFIDPVTGKRVLHLWAQGYANGPNTPTEFGYGQAWDKAAIDAGDCPVGETNNSGHGTTVAGTLAGNAQATGNCLGAAPASDMVIVATNFNAANWISTVADGVKYVFDRAAELGRPAVVNLSLGEYLGSHDGLDPTALFIDSMLMAAPGRAVVAAAGNSGCWGYYQMRLEPEQDTAWCWMKTNATSVIGGQAAFIDFWADTTDLNDINYSIGADRVTGGYVDRGRIPFRNVQGTINTYVVDTLYSPATNRLAVCSTFAEVRGGQYHLQIAVRPDSADYQWRVMMTGEGRADAWSVANYGWGELVWQNLPSDTAYPAIGNYVLPTVERGIVDSWACSPHVITVANANNELEYMACDGSFQDVGNGEGVIAFCSSHGYTRTDLVKPDVSAPGDLTFTAAPLGLIEAFETGGGGFKLHEDCMHVRAGGTSIASPAVAGAVALYLHKCPTATHTEIRDAIIATASSDAITGAVPNQRHGNGRLDAFAALNTSNFNIAITSEAELCEGDSAMATGPEGMSAYDWSDGSTDMNAWSQGEDLSLIAANASGCASYSSDIVSFTVLPAPPTPVITVSVSDLLSSSPTGNQWFLDGNAITGATEQLFTPVFNGDYTVQVTGANGCASMSDPYNVIHAGVNDVGINTRFALWPSPAHDVLHVSAPMGGPIQWVVVDARGRAVVNGQWSDGGTRDIELKGLAPAIYQLRLVADGQGASLPFSVR